MIMETQENIRPISLSLIIQKNVPNCDASIVDEKLHKLKRIWLDELKITTIDNLEMLGRITHLYLDFNSISLIQNLETLGTTLHHLSLKGNLITDVGDGLLCLEQLMSLDLSKNMIDRLSTEQFPSKLTFLNILENPVLTSEDFKKELLLKELFKLKVYNNSILRDDSDGEEESNEDEGCKEEESEEEDEVECLQDLTRNLRETSKVRQNIIEENHRHKLSALNIMKTEMSTEKRNPIPTNMSGSMQENGEPLRSVTPRDKNTLPPLKRPDSSLDRCSSVQSMSRVLLDPIPPKKSTGNRNGSPKQTPGKSQPRVNSPKRISNNVPEFDISLRQPLETALIGVEDFENYVTDVNKKFSDLRSSFGGL